MSSKLMSVAIDFGTTYSGYAFSFRHKKEDIYTYEWESRTGNVKTPTSVLFDRDQDFHSFGYEAEQMFASLSESGEEEDWYFFKRFKMSLFRDQNINKTTLIRDYTGKEMEAITVFSSCIRYMKQHLMRHFRHVTGVLEVKDIQWVLTVPAIWSDAAKMFMRKAAEQAGIRRKHLSLALEPEAAALWCRISSKIGSYQAGSQFMVVDCGGGTVDITVHSVQADGQLREHHVPTGGAWGGMKADDAFHEFLIEICGLRAIRSMTKKDMLRLDKRFENFKKNVSSDPTHPTYYSLKLPNRLHNNITALAQHYDKVKVVGDKIRIPADTVIEFYEYSIKKITRHIRRLLKNPIIKQTTNIILDKKKFPDATVYTPSDAASAVLKGAVLFGHDPDIVGWRIAQFTYGVDGCYDFDNRKHDITKRITVEGIDVCKDIFYRFVLKGDTIANGYKTPFQIFHPLHTGSTSLTVPIYKAFKRYTYYTTGTDCRFLGVLKVLMPNTSGEKTREVKVRMIVGGTELKVEAIDGNTGKVFESSFDFM